MARPHIYRTSEQIQLLKKTAGSSSAYLADQWVKQFGSSRKSEVMAKIEAKGRSFKEVNHTYLQTL